MQPAGPSGARRSGRPLSLLLLPVPLMLRLPLLLLRLLLPLLLLPLLLLPLLLLPLLLLPLLLLPLLLLLLQSPPELPPPSPSWSGGRPRSWSS